MSKIVFTGPSAAVLQSLLDKRMMSMALERALEDSAKAPKDVHALRNLSIVYAEMRDFVEAADALERALKLLPGDPDLMLRMAMAQLDLGETGRAMDLARILKSMGPQNSSIALLEAQIHLRCNRHQEVLACLEPIPEGSCDFGSWALQIGTSLVSLKEYDRAYDMLNRIVNDEARCDKVTRSYAWFQIAKAREKQKDYDGSWEAATQGHRAMGARASVEAQFDSVEALKATMHREALASWARASQEFPLAVFIVGMPRSGTSLLEQILSMHPDVANGGEMASSTAMQHRLPILTDSALPWPRCIVDMQERDADVLQEQYRRGISTISSGKTRVTDKNLLLVYQMGFMLQVLPGARSIMLHRHPLDNLVSCYTTHLAALGHSYTSDVRTFAQVWKLRRELQEFWMENLDPQPLELHYEKLVAEQESETRRLLTYLDIPWNDRCLSFHESEHVARTISFDQVNQKMYTSSVERWRRYEKHLGPAMEVLGLA